VTRGLLTDREIIDALARVHWRNGAYEERRESIVDLTRRAVAGEMTKFEVDSLDLHRLRDAAAQLGVQVHPLKPEGR